MGLDSFGLPAEEHAIKTNTHPRIQTEANINNFRRQLKMLGFSYDWDREIATTDVAYFRWTQWIFLQLYDTWFDHEAQRGRPIAELPIPADVTAEGDLAVRKYRDEHRLAYQSFAPVNWCPALGTVLANEEVIDGKSERGDHPVVRMPLRQWMLRITAYAERLENDLADLNWPESIKSLQRNWIGRSSGAEVDFYIGHAENRQNGKPWHGGYERWRADRAMSGFTRKPDDEVLRVYTTRPDTLFGATYMVIAPEHPAIAQLATNTQRAAVEHYCETAARKSDLDRTDLAKEKSGVFTGSYALNPVNGEAIPIWVADYVLISYGTGAIMAVPAHDERDFEFAQQFQIPIRAVLDPQDRVSPTERLEILDGLKVFTEKSIAINSGEYDGLATDEFKDKIAANLQTEGLGRKAINYKLRDWLFSRQRFWGEPFPILHELDEAGQATGMIRAVPESELPVDLPHLEDFKPHGRPEPPLDKAPDEWLYPVIEGRRYKRETNTMPQWAGSCWYFLRFLDPHNDQAPIDPDIEKAWMPIDLYVGGAEHAVLHLLYSRFWHKVLYDRGVVSMPEPFQRLINQGMILGEVEITGFQATDGTWVAPANVMYDAEKKPILKATGAALQSIRVPMDQVEKKEEGFVLKSDPNIRLDSRAFKMSKSRGNVVNPDTVVKEYGADSLRLYEMFMGPLEATKPWSMDGVSGVRNFLDRVWRLIIDDRTEDVQLHEGVQDVELTDDQNRMVHRTIKAVTEDIASLSFNTAIARMMEFTNFFTKEAVRPRRALEQIVLLLAPFAPHIAEELWQALGRGPTLAYEPWPKFDESALKRDTVEIPIQIKGKLRSKLVVPIDADTKQLEALARADARVVELLAEQQVVKVIVVPGRMVNFVTK
jgi:leucyl-tRNA synthetase